ncbi:MAG: hypothetical protein M3340_05490 [Actinomycetota bacterium]|nr:hypothetical protein [Actinomycetota bacterium]
MRAAALAAYVAVVGSVFTPLYDPLTAGRDRTWWIVGALAAAHCGVGAALRRPRALLIPLPVAAVAIVTSDAGLAMFAAVAGPLIGVVLIAAGWGLAEALRRTHRGPAAVAALAFSPALAVWGWAAAETIGRLDSPHAPRSLEMQLPNDDLGLGVLCDPEAEPDDARQARGHLETLIRELRDNPDLLVTYTYTYSDEPSDTREITVRELAEEQLDDLEEGFQPHCPQVERRLRDALGRS